MITLILLFAGHFFGDFVLVTPGILSAKKFGRPAGPVFAHAAVHAILTAAALYYTNCTFNEFLFGTLLMLVSHFSIDLYKGYVTYYLDAVKRPDKRPYWWLFGLDQFAHTVIILAICPNL